MNMHVWINEINEWRTKIYQYHWIITIWLFHIAMENPRTKCWFLAGKIIYFYGPWLPWLCRGSSEQSGHEAAHAAPLHANLQALFGGRWACWQHWDRHRTWLLFGFYWHYCRDEIYDMMRINGNERSCCTLPATNNVGTSDINN